MFMMYYYDNFFPFGMFGFGFLFMVLFWGLIFYGIVSLFKRDSSSSGTGRPMEILKERYAKGEITKEQFESMKKDLQ